MKNLLKFSFIFFIAGAFIACDTDDDGDQDPTTNTIADFVAANPNYSSLGAALDAAGLTAVLDGEAEFTVFAPDNTAFAAFLEANGFAELGDVPVPLLTQVLLNHVIAGEFESNELTTGYVNTLATFNGEEDAPLSMYINTSDNVVINGGVATGGTSVVLADVDVDNGVIHAVSSVINLPSVVTFALADSNTFSTLVSALTRDDQAANNYVGTLTTANGTAPAPFTVFAPTNDAFGELLTLLGAGSLADIDGPTLTATLNTHVIAGANVRAEDLTDGTVGTLGADIIIDAANATITDVDGRVINIIVTNVQAANGVVHAIDKVILPIDL